MTAAPMTARQHALWLFPPLLITLVFLAAVPWLRATIGQQALSWVGGAHLIFVVSYGVSYAIRVHRSRDEVQKAGTAFSATWGMIAGLLAFALLFTLPPFPHVAAVFIRDWANLPDATGKVVIMSMGSAVCGVALFQSIATIIMKMIWWKLKQ